MAFPVYKTASEALVDARRAAARLKSEVVQARAQMLQGNVSADLLINVVRPHLLAAKSTFAAVASTPGISEHAGREYAGVNGLDIDAEFNTMVAAVDAALSWLIANYPVSPSGWLAMVTWGGSTGELSAVTFTPAQTATFTVLLEAIDNSIATS